MDARAGQKRQRLQETVASAAAQKKARLHLIKQCGRIQTESICRPRRGRRSQKASRTVEVRSEAGATAPLINQTFLVKNTMIHRIQEAERQALPQSHLQYSLDAHGKRQLHPNPYPHGTLKKPLPKLQYNCPVLQNAIQSHTAGVPNHRPAAPLSQ